MGINNKMKELIRNGNTEDNYTRKYAQERIIPWLESEIKDLEGVNNACEKVGLGPMFDEDIEEAQDLLALAQKRWNL